MCLMIQISWYQRGRYNNTHFTDGETETQQGSGTWPRKESWNQNSQDPGSCPWLHGLVGLLPIIRVNRGLVIWSKPCSLSMLWGVTPAHCAAEMCPCIPCSPQQALVPPCIWIPSASPWRDLAMFPGSLWPPVSTRPPAPRHLVLKQPIKELKGGGIYHSKEY